MRFVETPVFTEAIEELLEHDAYRALQHALIVRPQEGVVIPKSGGLRKMRWHVQGKGKRGGCRVVYHWHEVSETFYMLYAYRKSEEEDISPRQLRVLSQLVQEEFE
jgi:hypothetical protein